MRRGKRKRSLLLRKSESGWEETAFSWEGNRGAEKVSLRSRRKKTFGRPNKGKRIKRELA